MGITNLEEIKAAIDLPEFVGQFVDLKRSGSQFKGCCPFHKEKTASFFVSSQTYHCFGCGAKGDVFRFAQHQYGLNFIDAVTQLASDYNIPLERDRSSFATKKKQHYQNYRDIYQVNAAAVDIFQKNLSKCPEHRLLLDVFGEEAIAEFKLGYALSETNYLTNYLMMKHHSLQKIKAVNLIKYHPRKNIYFDAFRDRLMIPCFADKINILGFIGLKIEDIKNCLVTPQLQEKDNYIFNLAKARELIKDKQVLYISNSLVNVVNFYAATGLHSICSPFSFVETNLLKINTFCELVFLFDTEQDAIANISVLTKELFKNSRAISLIIKNYRQFDLKNKQDFGEWLINYNFEELNEREFLQWSMQLVKTLEKRQDLASSLYSATIDDLLKINFLQYYKENRYVSRR